MANTRLMVLDRCNGRCEAMVRVGSTWARCFRHGVEVHHMLTRARGGLILDAAGETAHLIALCRRHHVVAHSPGGHEAGLMIDGYVTTGADGLPVYAGSDARLGHLGTMDLSDLPAELPGDQFGSGL